MSSSPTRAHQDMLRRITRSMATVEDLRQVLGSIANALVGQSGIVTARIWLLMDDHECDICRTGPYPEAVPTEGKQALHLQASAGHPGITSMDRAHHILPRGMPIPPAQVVNTREAIRWDDVAHAGKHDAATIELWKRIGARGAASYPLIFQGEVLGSIGMVASRPLEDDEFELLGIFADQAAMTIKCT